MGGVALVSSQILDLAAYAIPFCRLAALGASRSIAEQSQSRLCSSSRPFHPIQFNKHPMHHNLPTALQPATEAV